MLDNEEQLAKIITMENVSAKYVLILEMLFLEFYLLRFIFYFFWHFLLIWQSLFFVTVSSIVIYSTHKMDSIHVNDYKASVIIPAHIMLIIIIMLIWIIHCTFKMHPFDNCHYHE